MRELFFKYRSDFLMLALSLSLRGRNFRLVVLSFLTCILAFLAGAGVIGAAVVGIIVTAYSAFFLDEIHP